MEHEEYEEWEEYEVPVEEGEKLTLLSRALNHPRITFGGGSLVVSLALDIAIRFDSFVVVLGLATAAAIGWNADSLAAGMKAMIPGADQQQVQEAADHFAEKLAGDNPVYADQRLIAKFKRLIGRGNYEEQEPAQISPSAKKRRVIESLPNENRASLTVDRIATWFERGLIDNGQFFALLDRIDNPLTDVTRNARKSEPKPALEEAVSTQNEDVTGVTLLTPWDQENIHALPLLYKACNNLDKCLEVLNLSTSQENRRMAREILKQQSLWKDR